MSRRSHRPRRVAAAVRQLPWRRVRNPYPAVDVLSPEQIDTIIDVALTILETKGFRYLDDESRRLLLAAGAEPAGPERMLRLDRGLVREQLRRAPRGFPLRARNPERDLWIGDNEIVFVSVGGPAFCSDLDRGRRPGTYAEHVTIN